MAEQNLHPLKVGIENWNAWRSENTDFKPSFDGQSLEGTDLSGVDLSRANLQRTNFRGANLTGANLRGANLRRANLRGADLSGANLDGALMYRANLNRCTLADATLVEAELERAYVSRADLRRADFRGANLEKCTLVASEVDGARLSEANVYGVSAWDLVGAPAEQLSLRITPKGSAPIYVDNIKVSQFIYLLINNSEIRGVIDTITSKVILILGSFAQERKNVLDALRDNLRKRGFSPVVFDFDVPSDRDIMETVMLLAGMARFVIADLTNPRSVLQEIQAIAPDVAVPIQTVILKGDEPWAMFHTLQRRYHWVLGPLEYTSKDDLLQSLDDMVEALDYKRRELAGE